jgi:hypothetical protein
LAGKAVATTLVVTTGIVGGTVGYAAVDPAFRKNLGSVVPGSEDLLQMILGRWKPGEDVLLHNHFHEK